MRPLSGQQRTALERATVEAEANFELAAEYLARRALSRDTGTRFRLGVVTDGPYAGRLSIPAIGPNGVYSLRFRALDGREPKYLGMEGIPTRLFNLRALHEAKDEIHITEGEMDAMTLEQCGLHAVAVTGSQGWKKHHPRMFAGFSRVFLWQDSDEAGRAFVRRVSDSLQSPTAVSLMGEKQDVNSTFVQGGQEAIMQALKEASE